MDYNLTWSFLAIPYHPGKQGNEAVTGERGERRGGVIPQLKPYLPPPFHRSGHGDVEIRIDAMPRL
jgi:hypothetical protein